MKTTVSIVVVLFLAGGGIHASLRQIPGRSPITVLKCARVLDVVSGKCLQNVRILVEGEKIKSLGPDIDIPPTALIIDLGNSTVLPGLIDCHTHLLENYDGSISEDDNIILTVTKLSTASRVLLGAAQGLEDLQAGITTVRDLGNSGINGDIALREAINSGWVIGPRIIASTRALSMTGGEFGAVSPSAQKMVDQEYAIITGVEEAQRTVRQAVYDGADLIKVIIDQDPRMLSLKEVRAIVQEAHRMGRKVAAHAIFDDAMRIAVEAGVDSIEHGFVASDDVLKRMAEKKIFLVPTDWPEAFRIEALLKPRNLTLEQLTNGLKEAKIRTQSRTNRLKRAVEMGVPIAGGADIYYRMPGKTRGEASVMVFVTYARSGMAAIDIIRSITIRAAELLGWQSRIGSVDSDKFADLIAVEGDPLNDIGQLEKVRFVMKGGIVIKNELASTARQAKAQ
jgi:imidazolonepropionase-like amidohydrolase